MIKVSIMYANEVGACFDHDYYRETHMPMVKRLLGDACLRYSIDRGIAGGAPDALAPYIGVGHLYCDSVRAFEVAFAPHARTVMTDLKNYTNLSPIVQVSEIVVD